jgi:adenosylhomocysteine nucleosidase
MPTPPVLRDLRCSLLLLVATPAEEKGLREAAAERGIPCEKVKARESRLGVDYYDLGAIGNEAGVIALPPSRDDNDKLVMGSIGFFGTAARGMRFRARTGAQAIVQVGMAFGIDPKRQSAGDVLVSTSLIPYDNRDIRPASPECPRCQLRGEGFVTDYQQVTREPARLSLIGLFERERARGHRFRVQFGAMLSGAARIHSAFYRNELARRMPPGEDLIIGGEMEGVGLLAASETWGDPVWCVVKGISDFADENRNAVIDANRPVACRNAAFFVLSALANDAASTPGGVPNAN